MRLFLRLLLIVALAIPGLAQEAPVSNLPTLGGYLIETAVTPDSYVITNAQELASFRTMLPKVKPYKTLPATPNPDPFLNGYSPDFEESILVVATGRDRIEQPPIFQKVEVTDDGTRLVRFVLPERTAETFPYGWGVYTAVVLPRVEGKTKVVVDAVGVEKEEEFQRADFKPAKFKHL